MEPRFEDLQGDGGTVDVDFFAPSFTANPYAELARLRQHSPIAWSARLNAWVVTGHHEVQRMLKDHRLSSARTEIYTRGVPECARGDAEAYTGFLDRWLLFRDGASHRGLRAPAVRAVKPQRLHWVRSTAIETVQELASNLVGRTEFDLMADFAERFVLRTIARIIGIPSEDIPAFAAWSQGGFLLDGTGEVSAEAVRTAQRNVASIRSYLQELVEKRRALPQDDLLSTIAAEFTASGVSQEETIANCINIVVGSHETTKYLIGNAALALLEHPGQLAVLHEQPELLPGAVDELIRFDGSFFSVIRRCGEPAEFSGVRMEPGQYVFCMLNAANRDPERFELADQLVVTRRDAGHLGFGQGPHFCIGAGIGRILTEVALQVLVPLLTRFRVAGEPLDWLPSLSLRGLRSLQLTSR
ncbi:cytochrome P450 [Lentzea sp. NPDC051208]|uniref:cytochrome P450 n=1 Tax=Lentzea sp. NPDC051208 TaxID=3154642 RepID=UPI00344023C0